MSEPSSSKLPAQLDQLLTFLHERQEKRGNCTMKDRAELWLRFGGEYTWTERSSNQNTFDFTRHLFMFTIGATL